LSNNLINLNLDVLSLIISPILIFYLIRLLIAQGILLASVTTMSHKERTYG